MAKVRKVFSEFFARREGEEYSEEKIARDFDLLQKGDYTVTATTKDRSSIVFKVPDLTQPFALSLIEIGLAAVEGFGTAKINFDASFSDTPIVVMTPFGFSEIKVPWVAVSWRDVSVLWYTISIPIPELREMTIQLPKLCFLIGVETDGFTVLNVLGSTTIGYIAIGR
jgi:hypothetical protein